MASSIESSSDDFDKTYSVFMAVTDHDLFLYEAAPWSSEAWRSPVECYPLIQTRLIARTERNSKTKVFGIRCGTEAGLVVHYFRVETTSDLAQWASVIVNGSYASVQAEEEHICCK